MKLIARALTPDSGELIHALTTHYFPFHPGDPGAAVFSIVKNAVAPFDAWERQLERCSPPARSGRSRICRLLTQYERHGGYTIDARVAQRSIGRHRQHTTARSRPCRAVNKRVR
jgi:hypothetical protein